MCKALANSGKVCYTYCKQIEKIGSSNVIFVYNGRDGIVTDGNGLIYMRARYYLPDMRRFINADVVAGDISNVITLNRFAYANGNPVSMSDPFGLSAADQRGNPSSSSIDRDSSTIRYNKSSQNKEVYGPFISDADRDLQCIVGYNDFDCKQYCCPPNGTRLFLVKSTKQFATRF